MNQLKVLVIDPSYPDERDITRHNHLHNQLLRYHEVSVSPTVLELTPSQPGVRREVFEGIDVIRFGILPRGLNRSFIFRQFYAWRLRRLLAKLTPAFDLLHVHFVPLQLFPVASYLCRKPLVLTCHGDEVYPSKVPEIEDKRRALLNLADEVTGVSAYTVRLIAHYLDDQTKAHFVPNGVRAELFQNANERSPEDVRAQLGLPRDRKIVLMACSLIERKGVHEVLGAFHRTRAELPESYLVVIGNGCEKARMQDYIQTHGLDPHVKMIDYIENDQTMAYYYRASDLYIMFSKTVENRFGAGVEGFGISYIDANAAGIPVIGGRSGGVESAVVDGETGFLVDPLAADAVEQLHQRMRVLLADDALRHRMGEAGQKRVFAELTWSVNVRRIRALYDRVLETKKRPQPMDPASGTEEKSP